NTNRTVANIRSYFTKAGGSLGKTGSLDFIFQRKSVFRFPAHEDLDTDELELALIDGGLEELYIEADEEGNNQVVVQTSFEDVGNMQRLLEEMCLEVASAKLERIALSHTSLSEDQAADVLNLIDKIEEDDDVQAVYHNMEYPTDLIMESIKTIMPNWWIGKRIIDDNLTLYRQQ